MMRLAATWLRGAVRRPQRALVVVLTLVIMTVGTTGALVAADSLERLFVADAHAEWGEVDVEVRSVEDGIIELPLARELGRQATATARAAAPRLVLPAVVEGPDGGSDPDAMVLGLGAEEGRFAPLTAVDGTADVLSLEPGQALVNARLAERLDLDAGDQVAVHVAVPRTVVRGPTGGIEQLRRATEVEVEVVVAGVVADEAAADLHRTPNVLLRRDVLQRLLDLGPYVNVVHLAAAGDAPEDTETLVREIESAVLAFDLESETVLLDQLAIAEDEGGQFQAILFTLAALVLVAAGIAVTQMLTALAEDRSGEVGVLRLLGVHPDRIAWIVALEGGVYALVGSIAGAVAAVPLARWLSAALADHFAALAAGRGREQVPLPRDVDPGLLVAGGVVVLVVALVAGQRAGRRLSVTPVDTLLRGPLERLPVTAPDPRRPRILAAAGWLLLGLGLTGGPASDAMRYLGVTLLGLAWWTRSRRRGAPHGAHGTHRIDDRFALLGLAWSTLGALVFADFSQGFETGFGILVVAGLVGVGAAVGLLAGRFRGLIWHARTVAPRGAWQVALRTAGAWAEEARGRTGRLLAVFGMVTFVAAALHVLGSAMQVPAAEQAGGFDVIGTSVAGLDPLGVEEVAGGDAVTLPSVLVPEDAYGTQSDEDGPIARVRYPVRLAAADQDLAATQAFGLASALPAYPTAQEALTAVVRDRAKVVVDRYALPPGAGVGDDVVLDLGSTERRFQVIAVLDTFLLDTAFVNLEEFQGLVPSVGANFVLARDAARTPADLVVSLESAYREQGLDVDTVEELARDVVDVNRTFTDVFALIVLVGLAVAVVTVAASQARAARERAAALWVLRTLGVPRWAAAAALVAEPLAVAATGALVGLGVGLAVLRMLFAAGFSQLAFVVDVGWLLAAVGVVLAALALVMVIIALAATSRLEPPVQE